MKTTFIDRANTNEEVLRRANEQLNGGGEILPLSQVFLNRKMQFFCQVICREDRDPIRYISFMPGTILQRLRLPRRVGRPKSKWAQTEVERVWDKLHESSADTPPLDLRNEVHMNRIIDFAKLHCLLRGIPPPPQDNQ